MQVLCPRCRRVISGTDLNVATDVARCSHCDQVFPLSALVQANASGSVNVDEPPGGAWFQREFNGFVVGATTRHPMALFLVPFLCVWSGFSLGGVYGPQIANGRFQLLHSLFGIPFVLGTVIFGAVALMAICGKVVVDVRDSEAVVFTGIGPLGWRRSIDWSQVSAVRVEPHFTGRNRQTTYAIVLYGPGKLRFGSMLTETRRDFIANVLRQELLSGSGPRHAPM